MDTVTIQKISEESGLDSAGKAVMNMRVQFMVGQHGPFVERFPKAGFDPTAVQQSVTAFAQKLHLLTANNGTSTS